MTLYKKFLRFRNPDEYSAACAILRDRDRQLRKLGVKSYTTINTRWPRTWRNRQIEFPSPEAAGVAEGLIREYRF